MNSNSQSTSVAKFTGGAQTQDPAMVAERLTHLLRSPLDTPTKRNEVAAHVEALSAPANPVWIMARVAALLSDYYEKGTPQAIREIVAEDWLAGLIGRPEWAITAACRWWKGEANPNRNRTPKEGDIAERITIEMDAVLAAKLILSRPQLRITPAEQESPRVVTDEERSRRAAYAASILGKSFPKAGEAAL